MTDDISTNIVVQPRAMIDMHDAAVRVGDVELAKALEGRFPDLFNLPV